MVSATYEHIYLTGWVPDPSQQKPLMPGSAKMRLADALRSKKPACLIDHSDKCFMSVN